MPSWPRLSSFCCALRSWRVVGGFSGSILSFRIALRISNSLRRLPLLKSFHRGVTEVRRFDPFGAPADVTVNEFSEHSCWGGETERVLSLSPLEGALRHETCASLEFQCWTGRRHDLAGCERTGCARTADLGSRSDRACYCPR